MLPRLCIQTCAAGHARKGFLVGRFVVAGGAAGFAVHQAVGANACVDDGLAKATELFTLAVSFRLFALRAAVFGRTGSCGHEVTVARREKGGNVTLVMGYVVCFAVRGPVRSASAILSAI